MLQREQFEVERKAALDVGAAHLVAFGKGQEASPKVVPIRAKG